MPASKSPAKSAAKDVVIRGPTGPSWDAIRALAAGGKGDAAAASSQAKSFLSNPALPTLTGQTAAALAKLAAKVAAGGTAAAYKEVLALSDSAVAKLSADGSAAPAGGAKAGKKMLDVAALVAELCVGVGAAFAPDAIKALEKAATQEAKGPAKAKAPKKKAAAAAKKVTGKSVVKVRGPPRARGVRPRSLSYTCPAPPPPLSLPCRVTRPRQRNRLRKRRRQRRCPRNRGAAGWALVGNRLKKTKQVSPSPPLSL